MPLIGKVGRKHWRARLAMTLVYCALIAGAVTMLYPFLIMVSTGFKGPTDQNDNKLVPAFWKDEQELLVKYLDDKYAGTPGTLESLKGMPSADSPDIAAYKSFLESLPPELWMAGFRTAPNQVTSKLQMRYQAWLRKRFGSIDAVNRAYVEENPAYQTISLPTEQLDRPSWSLPVGSRKWDDWLEFKKTLSWEFRIPVRRDKMMQDALRAEYQNQFESVPGSVRGNRTGFEQLTFVLGSPEETRFRAKLPPRLQVSLADDLWEQTQKKPLPALAADEVHVAANAQQIRSEFSTRNYRFVLDYILLNGKALWNTLILCGLTILAQLIVNPLAAYALSRYPMPATGKILIFLLATMAFPAEVSMIPAFLLLKDVGLLNTFAALVFPAAASGYMIYLLKGFFDSLPQELYESGQMDGARESTMMMKIAFPLSRPVLGYLALLAFMGAYGAFMYAFLVCQNRDMWTLMVFIYQLQDTAPKSVMMAALALAAIPSLLVFLACQKVIMRGIVLPGER